MREYQVEFAGSVWELSNWKKKEEDAIKWFVQVVTIQSSPDELGDEDSVHGRKRNDDKKRVHRESLSALTSQKGIVVVFITQKGRARSNTQTRTHKNRYKVVVVVEGRFIFVSLQYYSINAELCNLDKSIGRQRWTQQIQVEQTKRASFCSQQEKTNICSLVAKGME